MRWRVLSVASLLVAGCLFPDLGALEGTEAGIDASLDGSVVDSGDAGFDTLGDIGTIPDVSVPTCDGACGAPAGFAPVLFATNQNTSCPQGTTMLNGAADPSLGGACACNCNVTQPPSCLPATILHGISDTPNACTGTSSFQPVVDGGCYDAGSVGLHAYWSIPPPPVVAPGTCTGSPANNPSAASATASRLCIDSTCASSCNATPGFSTCFFATGNVACPNGYTTHHVGNIAVQCGACSSCSVGGSCGGTVSIYSDDGCKTVLSTIAVDGGCDSTGVSTSLGSIKYTPAIVGLSCTPGTATGTVSLQQELTVCCP